MNKTHLAIAAAVGAVAGYAFADNLAYYPVYRNIAAQFQPPESAGVDKTALVGSIAGSGVLAGLLWFLFL